MRCLLACGRPLCILTLGLDTILVGAQVPLALVVSMAWGGAVAEFGFITDVHSQHITRTLALELGA